MPKLLIVDDEIDIREFAKSFFKKRGVDVFTASGGTEAGEIVEAENPDLILLDVRMEEMTGVAQSSPLPEGAQRSSKPVVRCSHVALVGGSVTPTG